MHKLDLTSERLLLLGPTPVFTDRFVYIEDRLLSKQYTLATLDDFTWRVYLFILTYANGITGYTPAGWKKFNSCYVKCSKKKFKAAIKLLVEHGLIKTEATKGDWLMKIPQMAPLWSEKEGGFVADSNRSRIQKSLKSQKKYFAMIPRLCLEIMLMDKYQSITSIRLMLKLYKIFNQDAYNCIDPNLIHVRDGILYYNPRLFSDLGIAEDEIVFYLNDLFRYLGISKRYAFEDTSDMDRRILICPEYALHNDRFIIGAFYPTIQYKGSGNEDNQVISDKS